MTIKKMLAALLALTMLFALTACGSGSETTAPAPAADASASDTTAPAADDTVYQIGICQLVQHVALDAATQGFEDALTELLGAEHVAFDLENASGDSANCPTICNQFVSNGVDLILANATSPLQSAAAATNQIPILGTSVTDYATALDLSDWNGVTGTNISGTSDLAPLDQQAAMLHELFPDAKNIGLLYCSAEPNSIYQVKVITEYLEGYGYTVHEYSFADSNDVASVAASACDDSDVLYIPTDNTAASCTEAINNVALPAGVPIVAGEEGICSGCGVATLSISYYDLGYATGKMAYEVLVNGADITAMAVQYAPNVTYKYNAANCDALGITVPENYEAIG
ncbi:MAG: ABC transporter substrate-binding protein [Oscillospiraceae bacterium]|nr:ABC transporter substrate-binding protein [Oscillospiraceae bacterium]